MRLVVECPRCGRYESNPDDDGGVNVEEICRKCISEDRAFDEGFAEYEAAMFDTDTDTGA